MITKEDIQRFIQNGFGPDPEEQANDLPPRTRSYPWLDYWWTLFKNIGGKQ